MSYASRSPATLDASALNATGTTNLGDELSAVGVTSWREISVAARALLNRCAIATHSGGFIILNSSRGLPHAMNSQDPLTFIGLLQPRRILTFYMFESDSYFETILNEYQNKAHGVQPLNPRISHCTQSGPNDCLNGTISDG